MAGHERDQLGTRMSTGLDWCLGRMPLPSSTSGERHVLQEVSNVVSELVVSGYCYLFLVLNYIGNLAL